MPKFAIETVDSAGISVRSLPGVLVFLAWPSFYYCVITVVGMLVGFLADAMVVMLFASEWLSAECWPVVMAAMTSSGLFLRVQLALRRSAW